MAFKAITTPRGSIVKGEGGMAELKWDPSFKAKKKQRYK